MQLFYLLLLLSLSIVLPRTWIYQNILGDISSIKAEIYLNHIAHSTSVDLPHVSLQFSNNLYISSMLDSGAMISCINKNVLNKFLLIDPSCVQIHRGRTEYLRSAGSHAMKVEGEAKVTFSLSGKKFTHTFMVVAGLSHKIILGEDFLKSHIRCKDYESNTLIFKDGKIIPFYRKNTDSQNSHVHIHGMYTIPARMVKRIPIITRKHIGTYDFNAIFIPKKQSLTHRPLNCEVVQVNNRMAYINYENHTDKPIILRSIHVGSIIEIRDPIIMTLEEFQNSNHTTEHLSSSSAKSVNHVSSTSSMNNKSSDGSTSLPPGFKIENSLTPLQQNMVKDLVEKYRSGFILHDFDHGTTDILEHRIDLTDSNPIHIRQFPLNPVQTKAVNDIVNKLEAVGKIEDSISPWNTPVFVVQKPDGRWRMVNDFRQLNTKTVKMEWPLPNIQHAIEDLAKSSWYTKIDLSDAFFQIPLKPEHREFTAFNTGSRHVQYKCMPMGLVNSSMTFQRLMNTIFRDVDWCKPYLDDLIIPADSFEQLLERTEFVFKKLIAAGLKMGGKKTQIGLREVKYLGFVCFSKGIRMDPAKIEAVQKWQPPVTVTQLRQFLGLCSHHRRFIKDYAHIAHPLTQLTSGPKNTHINWGPNQLAAFESLKHALSDPNQILAYPDFSAEAEPFIIETDACKVSEGAILFQMQNGIKRIIAYASRAFPKSEQAWGIPQQEAHAIYWAVTQQFSYYVRATNKAFRVHTDHKPCLAMQVNKVASERMYRWALALQEYNMQIFHVSGAKHSDADAISRLGYLKEYYETHFCPDIDNSSPPHNNISSIVNANSTFTNTISISTLLVNNESVELSVNKSTYAEINISSMFAEVHVKNAMHKVSKECDSISTIFNHPTQSINALSGSGYQHEAVVCAQRDDPSTSDLWHFMKNGRVPVHRSNYVRKFAKSCFMENDVIYRYGGVYNKQLLVPQCLQSEILMAMHDAPWAGHFGLHHTLHRISKNYWWPEMSNQVFNYVRSCPKCLSRNVPPHMRIRSPSLHDEIPQLFERIAVDVQGPFHKSDRGNRFIITFLDIHSRWIEAFCVKDTKAESIAHLFITEILLRYGPVRSLLSDRGPNFLSEIIRATCKIFRIHKIDIAAYHPQSNAKLERIHRTYSDAISKYVDSTQSDWDEYFPYIQWAYRTSIQDTLCETPYKLVYGRDVPDFIDLALLPEKTIDEDEIESKRVQVWKEKLMKRIARQQEVTTEMQRKYNEYLLSKQSQRPTRSFKIGDKVMIRRYNKVRAPLDKEESRKRTHKDNVAIFKDTTENITQKWMSRFIGPYEIIDRLGDTTYKIRHCADVKDIRTYNIDDLKRYYPRTIIAPNISKDTLPITGDDHGFNTIDDDEYEVEKILQVRDWEHGGGIDKEYFIRYKGLGPEHDTWILDRELDAPLLIDEFNSALKQRQKENRAYINLRRGAKLKTVNAIKKRVCFDDSLNRIILVSRYSYD